MPKPHCEGGAPREDATYTGLLGDGPSLSAQRLMTAPLPASDSSHPGQATQLVIVRHWGPWTLEKGDDAQPLAILQNEPSVRFRA